jgi:hypothetical protein
VGGLKADLTPWLERFVCLNEMVEDVVEVDIKDDVDEADEDGDVEL